MIFLQIILHSAVHIYDFHIFILLIIIKGGNSVVVNFLSRAIFVFLLFLGMMVMYANKVKTKEKQKLP